MKQKISKANALIIIMTVFSIPLSAIAGPSKNPIVINISGPATQPSQPTVPGGNSSTKEIKFSIGTNEVLAPNPSCPSNFGGTITGSGKATHLGAISVSAIDCITRLSPPSTPIDKVVYGSVGVLTITAANGDKLTGDYSCSFVPTLIPGLYSYSNLVVTIKGGTGRFSGATGTGQLDGTAHFVTGVGVAEGTLSVTY